MQVFIYSGLIIGALVVLLLIFFKDFRKSNNWLLGVSLLCIWYALFNNNLTLSEEVLKYPYLLRTGSIGSYLVFPFLYLYFRNSFYPGIKWRRRDWLVFVPALFYIIDMFPFFFASSGYKIEVMRHVLPDSKLLFRFAEGWITPAGFHVIFLYIWALFFYVLLIRLLYRNRNYDYGMEPGQNRSFYYFMIVLTLLCSPLIIPGIIGVIFQLSWFTMSFINIDFAATLLSVAVYLLLSPKVLYGFYPAVYLPPVQHMPEKSKNELIAPLDLNESLQIRITPPETESSPQGQAKTLSSETIEKMIFTVEQYILKEKPYLKPGYTIHDLSKDILIPVYQLSPIINQYFGTHFNTWLNRFRVEYFIHLAIDETNSQLTHEALAQKAGFSSRATFIAAFKKEKGCTPGFYLKSNVSAEI